MGTAAHHRTPLSRRRLLAAAAATSAAGAGALAHAAPARALAGPAAHPAAAVRVPAGPQAAREIRTEFLHAWNGYRAAAWGHDEVRPVSGTSSEFFAQGHPVGLSVIEALDTLYVMELDEDLKESADWLEQNLDFDIDADFHVFEAIIRVVGGLLAGHLVTGRQSLLDLCVDFTDRLLPAFTKSPTGMPYTRANLRTGEVHGTTPPLAEIGTNILEFGMLSRLTGDGRYYEAAKRAYRAVLDRRSSLDLLGTRLDVETGRWTDPTDQGPNPPVDSFYEYLWGAWELFGDRDCLRWWRLLNGAMTEHLVEEWDGHVWYRQVDFATGETTGRRQSELASFWGGLVAKGGDRRLGERYHRSWESVLQRWPVLPEEIDYGTMTPTSRGNQFRPEYVNGAFDLYWLTRDDFYRRTAWQYFEGMKAHARVPGGYTILEDVTTSPMRRGDLFPAYAFAENFKYLYLMFARTGRFDGGDYVLSTEGKILRGLPRRR